MRCAFLPQCVALSLQIQPQCVANFYHNALRIYTTMRCAFLPQCVASSLQIQPQCVANFYHNALRIYTTMRCAFLPQCVASSLQIKPQCVALSPRIQPQCVAHFYHNALCLPYKSNHNALRISTTMRCALPTNPTTMRCAPCILPCAFLFFGVTISPAFVW